VPEGREEKALEVVYQASHPKLEVEDLDREIELPAGLEEAFRAYVAARMFSTAGSSDALQRSAEHMARFRGSSRMHKPMAGWSRGAPVRTTSSPTEAGYDLQHLC